MSAPLSHSIMPILPCAGSKHPVLEACVRLIVIGIRGTTKIAKQRLPGASQGVSRQKRTPDLFVPDRPRLRTVTGIVFQVI